MMEKVSPQATDVAEKVRRTSSETFDLLRNSISNIKASDHVSSDDEDAPRIRNKKRAKRFSDSDSDSGREKTQNENISRLEDDSHSLKFTLQNDTSESDTNISKRTPNKSRFQRNGNLSDSEMSHSDNEGKNNKSSDSEIFLTNSLPHKSRIQRNLSNSEESDHDNAVKNKQQQLRIKNKRNNLQNKFKSLVKSREKEQSAANIEVGENNQSDRDVSSESGEEMASIEIIKQKIKERMSFKPSICDPDTSDEETSQKKPMVKTKKETKRTKLTSPKPQRMSAKQAMENMQKIKSESNRMLREKEVSLPYHRPKALSLKDIMNRRKPAVGSDGKALPIKMNEQQLKQYVEQLEERQKEMMELCKSESEEEENNENSIENGTKINKTNSDETISAANNANYITDMDISTKLNENIIKEDFCSETVKGNVSTDKDIDELPNEHDSETSMQLVYNDSANSVIDDQLTPNEEVTISINEYHNTNDVSKNIVEETIANEIRLSNSKSTEKFKNDNLKQNTDLDSQAIFLHFDSEKTDNSNNKNEAITEAIDKDIEIAENTLEDNITSDQDKANTVENEGMEVNNEFSDDEMNIADIDDIIANAEIIKDIEDKVNSQFLVRDKPLNLNPKLTGGPGMVIDLDDSDLPKKSGIELLKERFIYFSKLKTPEEMERERETKVKPGTQLNKLKQALEEQIAEQRSKEWAKRLEDEKQHQKELKELRGEESEEDDIDKIEAALENKEEDMQEGSEKAESDEEESIEDDLDIKDKPRVKNALLDDEAEESDGDDIEDKAVKETDTDRDNENEDGIEQNAKNEDYDEIDSVNDDGEENVSESDDSDESSESEEEHPSTIKRGRILKAFEDSDEEDVDKLSDLPVVAVKGIKGTSETKCGSILKTENFVESQAVSQDEELPLAQIHKSASEDLFTSQESALLVSEAMNKTKDLSENDEAFTQTFSILDSAKQPAVDLELNTSSKMSVVCNTQSSEVRNEDDMAVLCPLTDSQNNLPLPSQMPITQLSQSQPIGEDILALCTGQFYNNQFVSQLEQNQGPLGESQKYDAFDKYLSQDSLESQEQAKPHVTGSIDISKEKVGVTDTVEPKVTDNFIELHAVDGNKENRKLQIVDDNLKSILDELADPEFDSPKPNKFFVGSKNIKKDTTENENQVKKKFIIDSDDETDAAEATESKKHKKFKKKKPEKRALQISDDEEEMSELEEIEEYESDIEEENPDRLVEYDSEENEIEVKPQNPKKKRKKMTEFFENEAELTSEDEWVGSGDEDEAGLDRMEREEGDDETFHQGKLQRELGQIHMRDVLDQDKREVRLIQELLFEDGDLGDGGRQRKFRWNNMDGEEPGTVPDDYTDTQEEEFESEEQWRKQRHERETFLRQMQNKDDPDGTLNVSINRSTIIKANLMSRTMSSLLMEENVPSTEKTETPTIEKKTAKDVPSPKKPFALLQQSYQGSLLSRGRGALARLAALATPLAADDDAKVGTLGPSNRRNFVFTALTPEQKEPKVTKRKAESNPITPKLVKKMRTEDKQNTSRNSLLDHFKV